MSVRDIVSRDKIDDLWSAGYTIVKRQADPYYVDPDIIPLGMAYQWCSKADDFERKNFHWVPVPSNRHEGIYAPIGYDGDIEIGGLVLCEKAKCEVDDALAENVAKDHQNVADWVDKAGHLFTGSVKIGATEEGAYYKQVGPENTINGETQIPKELAPYILEIMRERTRNLDVWVDTKVISSPPTMADKSDALKQAIRTIRERHKDELHANPA